MTTNDFNAVRLSNDVTVSGNATRALGTNTIGAQVTVALVERDARFRSSRVRR